MFSLRGEGDMDMYDVNEGCVCTYSECVAEVDEVAAPELALGGLHTVRRHLDQALLLHALRKQRGGEADVT
jgi:hypothetical protein